MGIWDNAKAKKEHNDAVIKRMKEGKQLFAATVKYSGGHREVTKACDVILVVNPYGVFFRPGITQVIHLPIESIIRAEYVDGTQISKDVTLTRLLLFNILAFGLKKKRTEEHHFIVITYIENGIENKIIFEHKKAPEAVGAIMQAKHEYINTQPILEVNTAVKSIEEEPKNLDIPEQIRKLAALKEDGILTDEEFQNKKAELLSRL